MNDNLFGGFIWSHIKLQELPDFILKINNLVRSNGIIVFIDNNYVEGSSSAIISKDESGNTYQTRKLKDGSDHIILKNFPSEESIKKHLNGIVREIKFINLKYYWILTYKNKD
jgi:demethylmenaquinone methyltransferase/2-methoxy-6-polyprenyl-1,4-benzoquinol methylase